MKIKNKDKILGAKKPGFGQGRVLFIETKIRVTFDFSEAMQARREVFKVLRGKKYQLRILYSAKLPFKSERASLVAQW